MGAPFLIKNSVFSFFALNWQGIRKNPWTTLLGSSNEREYLASFIAQRKRTSYTHYIREMGISLAGLCKTLISVKACNPNRIWLERKSLSVTWTWVIWMILEMNPIKPIKLLLYSPIPMVHYPRHCCIAPFSNLYWFIVVPLFWSFHSQRDIFNINDDSGAFNENSSQYLTTIPITNNDPSKTIQCKRVNWIASVIIRWIGKMNDPCLKEEEKYHWLLAIANVIGCRDRQSIML